MEGDDDDDDVFKSFYSGLTRLEEHAGHFSSLASYVVIVLALTIYMIAS